MFASKTLTISATVGTALLATINNTPSSPPATAHLIQPPPTPTYFQTRLPKQKQAKNPLNRWLRSRKGIRHFGPLQHILSIFATFFGTTAVLIQISNECLRCILSDLGDHHKEHLTTDFILRHVISLCFTDF